MREKKKFVVYYKKEKFLPDPFADFGEKRDVHYALFIAGIKRDTICLFPAESILIK